MRDFLPITIEDMKKRGWERPDFVYVIGDAYVDHSSFGPAIISRVLESRGYKVAFISQPDWKDDSSITVFGEPRLGFLVSAGNMDSMVNHYSVSKKHRGTDAYTPGGVAGKRPDYATIVYCNLIKRTYKNTPILIGGIEASLRRLGHYDYWSNKMKRSILMDSGADLLMYGMGELASVAVAEALDSGMAIEDITYVPGTVYKAKDVSGVLAGDSGKKGIELPDYDEIASDKISYAKSFKIQYENTDFYSAKPLIEKYGEKRYIVQNPPSRPLTTEELDDIYELPYMDTYHPSYEALGGVPAISEIRFSLTSNRGCFGGCSFCALTFHQGRVLQVRSHESLIREAKKMINYPDFKGYIHDVGGPTANFRRPACDKQFKYGACPNKQCLYPGVCQNMKVDHSDYVELLRKLRKLPGVKKVFVRSGIRFDYMMADKDNTFFEELCKYHISGQLRVAPEHVTDHVLDLMGKPRAAVYRKFVDKFERVNSRLGLKQYIVPYLISSHPGSDLKDAIALAESVRDMGYMPEQVQDFYPTPSTISTCMYYCGVDPRTMKPVNVTINPHEKAMQRALIQYRKPENYDLVKEALIKEHREDLIGFGPGCLIPPRKMYDKGSTKGTTKGSAKDNSKNSNQDKRNRVDGKDKHDSSRENITKNGKRIEGKQYGKEAGKAQGRQYGKEAGKAQGRQYGKETGKAQRRQYGKETGKAQGRQQNK